MGMGLAGLGMASGAAQGLQEILAQRLRERQMALQEQNSAQGQGRWEQEFGFRKAESEREAAERAIAQQIQLEILRGNQQNKADVQADRTADNLAIGDRFGSGAPQISTLERGGLGNLMKAIPMSPDQAMPRMKIGAPGQMGAKPVTAEYAPGEYEYQGTGTQRMAQDNQRRADERLDLTEASQDARSEQFNRRMDLSERRLEATLGAAGRSGWTVQNITLPDGTTKAIRVNPNTGQTENIDLGGVPTTADMANRSASMKRIGPVLSGISELSEKINTGKGVAAKAQGGVARAEAQANLNDDVAEYEALISGFTPMVARAVGHSGVLTEQDVQSVKALFPRPGDSKTLRDRKIKRIMTILGGTQGAPAAGGDVKEIEYDMNGKPIKR